MDPSIYARPDKRDAAFNSIFGRPTAVHHQQPGPSNLNYQPSYSPSQRLPPQPPSMSQPSYAYPQPLNGRPPSYLSPNVQPGQYVSSRSSVARSTSMRTESRSQFGTGGIISPQPVLEEPEDMDLQASERSGLTPAQAYQRQVYLNREEPRRPNWEPNLSTRPEEHQHFFGSDIWEGGTSNLSIDVNPPEPERLSPRPSTYTANRSSTSTTGTHSRVPSTNFVSSPTSTVASAITTDEISINLNTRRSSDSVRTVPSPFNAGRREKTSQDRAKSMSATTADQARSLLDIPKSPAKVRRAPLVYPALLSRVANAFQERITLSERAKDGLTYPEAFDGREAVDKITYIIKTTDRNLALLLGRALDSQKFFHEVTYDKRLRDSSSELYQFRNRLATPFAGDSAPDGGLFPSRPPLMGPDSEESSASYQNSQNDNTTSPAGSGPTMGMDEHDLLPTGVFTLLTDCYSPTCSRDQLCYSIICPRRLEQQAHLNMKPQQVLQKNMSQEDVGDVDVDVVEPGTLWIHSVPKEVADSVSDTEKKRQEAINEVIYTERDFVRDMEYLRDLWIKPLQTSDVIPEPRRTDFLQQVFWNLQDIIAVNTRLRDALNKRQRSYAVVERIGDILLDAVPYFEPFVVYGSHQLYGKYEFEKEKTSNPAFAQFAEETERRPESRKLELNGYLTKPTTRLARYPLLLEQVLKFTSDDNPDKVVIPKVIALVKEFLTKVNVESGKSENRFNLWQLDQQLVFKPGEVADLRLRDEKRELLYKGSLNRRGGAQNENGDLIVFLFDHALLMVKQKAKYDQYKVYRRPIPLELLQVYTDEANSQYNTVRGNKTLTKRNSFTKPSASTPNLLPLQQTKSAEGKESKSGYPITFIQLGRHSYQITLYASTWVNRKKWMEQITKQQGLINQRSLLFGTSTLSERFFIGSNRVNCAAPFARGRRIAYGTNDGVYFADLAENHREPMKMLALPDVWQLDIMDEYELLIVLTENEVATFPLEALSATDTYAGLKRAKRIASHISYFKAGVCTGRPLVCVVKTSPLSTTIRALEPIDQRARGKAKPTFRTILQGGHDTLRLYKEFYIPVESYSVHFLKTKLCVGCTKGFEIVDLDTLDTQGLLDPDDSSLDFATRSETVKPMAIYRIENEFLLCYDDFAFYVNKSGWRAKKNFMVHWEGRPSAFALQYPYVLAFEPSFVEIRHVETGQLMQIIKGHNLRCLFADTPPSSINYSQASFQPRGPGGGSFNGRPPIGAPPGVGPPGFMYRPPYARDEILLVSDDKIMILRSANFFRPQGGASDNASIHSSTFRR